MPKVTAWQCPHTGDLFATEKAYRSHLAKLARARRERKKIEQIRANREALAAEFRAGLHRVADIGEYVLKNQRLLWDLARRSQFSWRDVPSDWYPVVENILFDLRYSESVSNTHSCPLNGVKNWGGRTEDAPRGYPGYTGSVAWWTRIDGKKMVDRNMASDLFRDRLVCINTGTGGGSLDDFGLVKYRYDVKIFLADWPGLAKELFVQKLAGVA